MRNLVTQSTFTPKTNQWTVTRTGKELSWTKISTAHVLLSTYKYNHEVTMVIPEYPPVNQSSLKLLEDIWGPQRNPLIVVIPVTVLYGFILIFGFFGNIITCIVVVRNKYMRTVTNYYLLSLAISDLLLLIVGLPTEIYQMWYKYPYVFGELVCILQGLAAETSANATVLTITAFTIERYIAISYPFFSHTATKLRRAVRYIILIWILSFVFAIPQAIQMGVVHATDNFGNRIDELSICSLKDNFIPHSFEISMFLFFVAPMSVITVLYILIGIKLYRPSGITLSGKRKAILIPASGRKISRELIVHSAPSNYMPHSKSTKRVVKMLVAVVVAFFICWAPFQTQRLLAVYGYTENDMSDHMYLIYEIVTYISGILYYFSTVVNPILYNIMSNKFRKAFRDTVTICLQNEIAIDRRNSGDIGRNSSACHPTFTVFPTDDSHRAIVISFRKPSNECKITDHTDSNNTLTLPTSRTLISSSLPGITNNTEVKNLPSCQENLAYVKTPKQTFRHGTSFYSE